MLITPVNTLTVYLFYALYHSVHRACETYCVVYLRLHQTHCITVCMYAAVRTASNLPLKINYKHYKKKRKSSTRIYKIYVNVLN